MKDVHIEYVQMFAFDCTYVCILEKGMATHSSILAWRVPQRSLVSHSPWCHKSRT